MYYSITLVSNETITFVSNEVITFVSNEVITFVSNETIHKQKLQDWAYSVTLRMHVRDRGLIEICDIMPLFSRQDLQKNHYLLCVCIV